MKPTRLDSLPRSSTREVFSELVSSAGCDLRPQPTTMATVYLVDLLEARVRSAPPPPPDAPPDTLAESLVSALLVDGAARMARLRALGDRALFDAGFFGPSLCRRTVGVRYYADIGATAYSRLSRGLAVRSPDPTGAELFSELASRFGDFVALLSDVGERARGSRDVDLLGLYDRYRTTRSPRDRARLLRRGLIVPGDEAADRLQ